MRIERVPLSALPGHFTPLAAAFFADDPRLRSRFALSWRDDAALVAHARRAAGRRIDPDVMARLDPGPARDKLAAGAAAVVTGQQPSVALGPLYNVLKAITAVRWARRLEAAGVPAVPVFWNHSDDDNLEGLNRLVLPDRAGALQVLETPWEGEGSLAFRRARLDFNALAALLPESPDAMRLLRENVKGDVAADFSRLLRALFGPGLLVVEPRQLDGPRAREVFRRALADPKLVQRAVDEGGDRLKELGFDRSLGRSLGTNVYAFDGPRRVKVEGDPPPGARLSAGVALRLILQDSVLPSALTISGPNEVAYLAQLRELYKAFDLEGPVAAPRITATLVDPRAARIATALGLSGAALLGAPATAPKSPTLDAIDALGADAARRFDDLERHPAAGVRDATKKTREKVASLLAAYRERAAAAELQADHVASERIRKLAAFMVPEGKLQERALPVWNFLAVAGPGLVQDLADALDPLAGEHQIVWL